MSDHSECNCAQALALKERIAELEGYVVAYKTRKWPENYPAGLPSPLADEIYTDLHAGAAAERARIVAWMKARNEDMDRPGVDGAIWAREIESCAHLPSATEGE